MWHISGWNYNLKLHYDYDAFFIRNIASWGWATWSDRFKKYEKNPTKIIKKWKKKKINKFNLDNYYNFFSQVVRNYNKKLREAEDHDLILRLNKISKGFYLPIPLYRYYIHGDNISNSGKRAKYIQLINKK